MGDLEILTTGPDLVDPPNSKKETGGACTPCAWICNICQCRNSFARNSGKGTNNINDGLNVFSPSFGNPYTLAESTKKDSNSQIVPSPLGSLGSMLSPSQSLICQHCKYDHIRRKLSGLLWGCPKCLKSNLFTLQNCLNCSFQRTKANSKELFLFYDNILLDYDNNEELKTNVDLKNKKLKYKKYKKEKKALLETEALRTELLNSIYNEVKKSENEASLHPPETITKKEEKKESGLIKRLSKRFSKNRRDDNEENKIKDIEDAKEQKTPPENTKNSPDDIDPCEEEDKKADHSDTDSDVEKKYKKYFLSSDIFGFSGIKFSSKMRKRSKQSQDLNLLKHEAEDISSGSESSRRSAAPNEKLNEEIEAKLSPKVPPNSSVFPLLLFSKEIDWKKIWSGIFFASSVLGISYFLYKHEYHKKSLRALT